MTFALLGLLVAGYLASLILRGGDQRWLWLDGWGVCAVELVACALCMGRALLPRPGRTVALVLGLGLLSWTLGDIVLTIESLGGVQPTSPSLADVFYLAFYPLAYVALMMFMHREARRFTTPNWLDGAIAGLGAAAVCAAFAFQSILQSTGDNPAATITNLAYPVGDVLLLGLVAGVFAALSGRRRSPWILLACGMALNVLGDTSNLLQSSLGASRFGVILNAVAWPTAIVVMSMAVWLRGRPSDLLAAEKPSGFVLPNAATASALAILLVASVHSVGRVAIVLAAVTLLTVAVRLALSVREMQIISRNRHRQSVTDDLTGLRNRRYLFQVLDSFFAGLPDSLDERSLAFLFVDLNGFKEINDSFGHPAGDDLLKQLGARLSSSLRDTDLLVRLGGDEFAVVLVDSEPEHAIVVAQRLTAGLEKPFLLDAVSATISASIGIAMAPSDATNSAALMWCADVAMYRAKLETVSFATYKQNLDAERDHMRLLEELRVAVGDGRLVLHYQPQLDLRSGEILAVEALLRWPHPRLGLLLPLRFLPLAEDAGLMPSITAWVVREAVTQCAAWRQAGRPMTVAVNVPPSILLEPGFVAMVKSQLDGNDVPAEALVVEITETSVISDLDTARRIIEELRDSGVMVSVDDFGAGATSLAYLSNLSVGELKLDRTFIAGLATHGSDRDLDVVRSTIELGHAIGLRIVAEGIEDHASLKLLSDLGCDVAQGYCISKPKPARDLAFRPVAAA